MRSSWIRLAAFGAGIVVLMSCDGRLPTSLTPSKGSSSSGNATPPAVAIDSPLVASLINVGDSVYVRVHVHDDQAVTSLLIGALSITGDQDLGTYLETPRYTPLTIQFRPRLVDTTIRRYIKPINPADTTLDSLIIIAVATDSLGAVDTARVRVDLVSGPVVSIVSPTSGDSVPAGVGVSITARAAHPDGVSRVDIRVRGEASWPTKLDTTITQLFTGAPREVNASTIARIPLNAPVRSRVTITATATDVNRQVGASSPLVVFVRNASAAQPRVTQTVSVRTEITDSVQIKATGEGIAAIGVVVRDSVGTVVKRDSVLLPQPLASNVQRGFAISLPITQQGKRVSITSFAVDQAGRTGYAVRASQNSPAGNLADALADSTLIVYGRTFALPRQGVVGDIAVDATRGNVFLSNTDFNRLEVWQNPSHVFDGGGVAVGSLPWGMFVSMNPDTLLVANSGGTNISRVFIGSGTASSIHEDLPNRILTRNTYTFGVTQTLPTDSGTGVRLSGIGPISYSDRPQYIAQSAGGRIFYSTRPTNTAVAGTIRWLDPKLPVPDPRQVWQYGKINNTTVDNYALFNVDSIVFFISIDPAVSDLIRAWDHPYGQRTGVVAATDSTVQGLVAKLNALGSDAEGIPKLDISSLDLTDTTFVAASGNRKWLAFGEGNTKGAAGRVIMVADSLLPSAGATCIPPIPSGVIGCAPNFFSPVVTVQDLTDNASESVFGLALDQVGRTVASHGLQSYFAEVADPFHLRLQGKFDTFDNGAGIALHPSAAGDVRLMPSANRLAFVGAASGVIELVDIAYYISRGKLQLKNTIYGPLRVSGPMPGDAPEVILKVFAVSPQGLVVIDLTAGDIKPGP